MASYDSTSIHNLVLIPWLDPETGGRRDIRVQFYYGDCWAHIYRIGDEIRWGGNDIGDPSIPAVITWGFAEEEGVPEVFVIHIVNNIIRGVVPWDGELYWGEEYYLVIDPIE